MRNEPILQLVVQSDIDGIIEGIKEAYRRDSTSAPKGTAAEEIHRAIEEAAPL